MYRISEKELMEYEKGLRQAMLDSNIVELDRLISSELIFTNHMDLVMTKSEDLAAHTSGSLNIEEIALSDYRFNILGDVAIVSVLADILGEYDGKPANGRLRFTRVWRKGEEGLEVVAGHASMLR